MTARCCQEDAGRVGGVYPHAKLPLFLRNGRKPVVLVFLFVSLGFGSLAAASDPPAVTEVKEEAARLRTSGQSAEALKILQVSAARFPTSATLAIELGKTHLSRGEHAKAIEAFERGLSLRPDEPVARYNLAYALRRVGRLDDAARTYEVYLKTYQNDADAWFDLAETQVDRKALKAAAFAYERYAETETRAENKRWVEEARQKVIELRAAAPSVESTGETSEEPPSQAAPPRRTTARGPAFEAALDALRAGRYEEALAALDRLPTERTERTNTDYAVLAARAGAHLGRKEGEVAQGLYERALQRAPERARAGILLGLAEAHRINGNSSESRAVFDRILALPDLDPALAALARARRTGS